jgi:hypothetical protein
MDLTLGGPVEVNKTSKLHSGNCNDSIFGCIKCWNAAGKQAACDICGKVTTTFITKAWDEPVLYAMCTQCMRKNSADVN